MKPGHLDVRIEKEQRLDVSAALEKAIVADTGWPMTTVFRGFNVALVVSGFISTWVGRLIDRIGSRAVMGAGTTIVWASAGRLGSPCPECSELINNDDGGVKHEWRSSSREDMCTAHSLLEAIGHHPATLTQVRVDLCQGA